MTRNPDIIFTTEYIQNVLYFAVVRPRKVLHSTSEVHYFSIDNELLYMNYYADFGPLNLGCVYLYCKILNEKLQQFINKQTVVHYTSADPKKKANAAFLIGCYGVLYLNLTPRDALKPLLLRGQSYKPFQDATQGESMYTITIMDCLCAIKKAESLDFFNFQDFNFEEYERLDKLDGGDLNWIVPGKFLAFIGPMDYSIAMHHPPEMYIQYFRDNNVRIVIRLNKRMYDADVFTNAGIMHYDLFFPDGSCPPRHILTKFLQISEESEGAIAVHCKAGLGRTGSLIGCYLIKHYRMTAHEAIAWMRICRPGSVIGHQQGWLEHLEPWLIKQGNIYRKRKFQDPDCLPEHEYGVYSITEKMRRQKPLLFNKVSMSQAQRTDYLDPTNSQDLRTDRRQESETEQQFWNMMEKMKKYNANNLMTSSTKGSLCRSDVNGSVVKSRLGKRSSGAGAGEPRPPSCGSSQDTKSPDNDFIKIPTFQTSQGPMVRTLSEAKNYLKKSSLYAQERDKALISSVTVTPIRAGSRNTTQPFRYGVNSNGRTNSGAGSLGAASLGARRVAPSVRRAPSVRSDERATATQGDMLNSIKLQRRFRETLNLEKTQNRTLTKDKPAPRVNSRLENAKMNSGWKPSPGIMYGSQSGERSHSPQRGRNLQGTTKSLAGPRPSSPNARCRTPYH